MPILALLRSGRGLSPLSLLATLLVLTGIFAMIRDRVSTTHNLDETSQPCAEAYDPSCASEPDGGAARRGFTARPEGTSGPVLSAETACVNVGYLCSELESRGLVRIQQWKDFEGTIVVHIPRPVLLAVRRRPTASRQGRRGGAAVERSALPNHRGRARKPRGTLPRCSGAVHSAAVRSEWRAPGGPRRGVWRS